MKVFVIDGHRLAELLPLTCTFDFQDIPVCGISLKQRLQNTFAAGTSELPLTISPALWPSPALTEQLMRRNTPTVVMRSEEETFGWISKDGTCPGLDAERLMIDDASLIIRYPWDILAACERVVGELREDRIAGTVRERVTVDGHIELGEGSVLLPGVYIEGNVIIGKNTKVGPNCYIRGNTYIGDNCHVGQAVEIKNSMLMDKVAAGHLSYLGDTVVGPKTNFGAGTITANFRHDGKNHRSLVKGELVDTGRRKFGAIVGANVHTGIHTSIYPGRKIWADMSTRPGDVVQQDIRPE